METAQLIEQDYSELYFPVSYQSKINIQLIILEVSMITRIPSEIFLTQKRKREYVIARQLTMFLAKEYTNQSPTLIGNQVANMDRGTVDYAYRTIKALIDTNNPEIMKYYPELVKRLDKMKSGLFIIKPLKQSAETVFNTEK